MHPDITVSHEKLKKVTYMKQFHIYLFLIYSLSHFFQGVSLSGHVTATDSSSVAGATISNKRYHIRNSDG